MPAYNAGSYIIESINSVIDQSYKNWELIIVNDGSTDNTSEQLEKLKDDRIKIYHQENKGQCTAANKAFSLSKGELIKFMDADDLISPDFIKNQVEVIAGSEKTIASASWGRFYNNDLNTFKLVTDSIKSDRAPIDWLVESMTGKQVMLQCALWLIPRPILTVSGLWNEKLSLINDFEFFIRVFLKAEKISYADDAILYYRSGLNQSLSGLKSKKGAESAYESIDLGVKHMLDYESSPRIRNLAANHFQHFVYDFYPSHASVTNKAEQKIKDFGGSSISYASRGYTKILTQIIGWKACKKIKYTLSAFKNC
ncbi:glycosyltransferase family 2 protein [Mucilaginibacter mallensis]|nr:glycosyltransferase family A protein [Mucilaginibacter mallensis]